jgi:hypothetical protein
MAKEKKRGERKKEERKENKSGKERERVGKKLSLTCACQTQQQVERYQPVTSL